MLIESLTSYNEVRSKDGIHKKHTLYTAVILVQPGPIDTDKFL